MVLADSLADALYPKAMPLLMGGQAALRIRKGIQPAGIYEGDDNEWGAGLSAGVQLDKGVGNATGRFKGIVQQVAEQGGKVAVRDEINGFMPDVGVEGDVAAAAFALVPIQDCIEHFILAQTGGFFQI